MDPDIRVMVSGCRPGSLGNCIVQVLREQGVAAYAAGISDEIIQLPMNDHKAAMSAIETIQPTHVICTAGVNDGGPFYAEGWSDIAEQVMKVNYLGPMTVLSEYQKWLEGMPGTFVAISSNSALIARSHSAAYCASKAALSMALRCAARDVARAGLPLHIWGYEPGAIFGTPMTQEVRKRLDHGVPLSRMLTTPEGLSPTSVARIIARDTLTAGDLLHGTMVRLDAGEQ